MALFEIRELRKTYGNQRVLDSLSLDIERGEFLTIIGRSGGGKSLLLKSIVGLVRPESGSIVFDGREILGAPESEWVSIRRRIGMLFQESALFDSLSVADNIAYGLREQRMLDEDAIRERVSSSLATVSLPGIERMSPVDLSGGMRKRVALARAIAMRPEVVLYDEPTEGLDPINVTRVNRLLLNLRRDMQVTTVVVTQNMASAFTVSDRIAFVDEGRVVAMGTPDELRANPEPRLRPFRLASELKARVRNSEPGTWDVE